MAKRTQVKVPSRRIRKKQGNFNHTLLENSKRRHKVFDTSKKVSHSHLLNMHNHGTAHADANVKAEYFLDAANSRRKAQYSQLSITGK